MDQQPTTNQELSQQAAQLKADGPAPEAVTAKVKKPEVLSEEWLAEVFTYHPATEEQVNKYHAIREGAKGFARLLRDNVPASADRTAALRLLRECVHSANAAVALNGLV